MTLDQLTSAVIDRHNSSEEGVSYRRTIRECADAARTQIEVIEVRVGSDCTGYREIDTLPLDGDDADLSWDEISAHLDATLEHVANA